MKFEMKSIAAREFTIDAPAPTGDVKVVLGPSEEVSGFVDVAQDATHIRAASTAVLSLAEVHVPSALGPTTVVGDLRLHEPDVDVRIGPAGVDGHVVVSRAKCDRLRVDTPAMSGIDMDDVSLSHTEFRAAESAVQLTVKEIVVGSVTLPLPQNAVQGLGLRAHDLQLTTTANGHWTLRAKLFEAKTLHGPLEHLDVGAEGLRLEDVCLTSLGRLTATRVASGRTRLRVADIAALSAGNDSPPRRGAALPIDLALLSLITGHIHADVVTDVKIPVIKSRRANHPVRLDVRDGMVQWRRLESCLANLEDAVLDFTIEDDRLCLIKDIPLVPFDKKTLVSWDLPGDEFALAKDGWVKLARLFAPRVEIATKPKGTDDGGKFVNEVSASNIQVGLNLAAHAGWSLRSGGTLRLGVVNDTSKTLAVMDLNITGNVVYRPDEKNDPGELEARMTTVCVGVEGLPVGGRRLSSGLRVDRARARMRFDDVRPKSIEIDVEGTQLTEVVLDTAATWQTRSDRQNSSSERSRDSRRSHDPQAAE